MTAPGFVPRPSSSIEDRIVLIEKRIRNIQQNVAGATTANAGVGLSNTTPSPVGAPSAGAATTASRSDHAHGSTLAAQTDVTITSPTAKQPLVYNGTSWANATLPSPSMVSGSIASGTTSGTITHNLGNTCPVVVFRQAGVEIDVDNTATDGNRLTFAFPVATAVTTAYLIIG